MIAQHEQGEHGTMKHYRTELRFNTTKSSEIQNITPHVERAVQESGIQEGLVLVYPLHTSSTVYISDSDYSLTEDFADLLEELVPSTGEYRHDQTDFKKNAAGHLKTILAGHSVTLPLTGGRLDLGTYQTIYYFEFDGRRKKEVLIKIIGE
jgi:secondary thiamine-phosphate synthase enzyme